MAVAANYACADREKFKYCYSKLIQFTYNDGEAGKTDLNLLLDQLNSLEYSTVIVSEQNGNTLLKKLCSTIPLHEDRLVVKLCQITNNWKRKQMLQLSDECIGTVTDYFIKAVERCQGWATPEILRALASVFYENVDRVDKFHDRLLGKQGILVQLINNKVTDPETLKEALLCVECLTIKPTGTGYLSAEHVDVCFDLFCMLLHKMPTTNLEPTLQCKILINCFRGIQNMIQMTKVVPFEKLGIILAAIRAYMFFGLYSQPLIIPDCLYPSPLIKIDIPVTGKLLETQNKKIADNQDDSGAKKSKRKTKKRGDKHGGKPNRQSDEGCHGDDHDVTRAFGAGAGVLNMEADMSGYTPWSKISSSESEWSDTEGGQSSRLRSNCSKVRQWALSCFYWIIKMSDKKIMFSFWSSFIPDSQSATNMSNSQSLFTVILKDPSSKCRMGALAALCVLVDGTKHLLTAAEDRDDSKVSTFTPFSVILGTTIKEMHRCLLQALISEEYPMTLTQLIKCFGTIIANVPYHRMRPGLLSRIIKQVKHFINHRDPNVRVACLTCLGSMAGIQPPLMEVCHIIQPSRPPVSAVQPVVVENDASNPSAGLHIPNTPVKDTESGYSSSPVINSPSGALPSGGTTGEYSGGTTPKRDTAGSSGIQTPVFSDQLLQAHSHEISWVVKLCIKNILPRNTPDTVFGAEESLTEPIPVRLESLQVLANLTKGYFPIIRNCVPMLQELVHKCFCDNDPVIKLHTAKLLDEFTQVLLQDVIKTESEQQTRDHLDKQQVLDFWMSLLNGPIQEILQNPVHGAVRATICDCIANIGDPIFIMLPVDKRIMCLTVVLGLTNDEDRFIRASAVRTLGVYVLYKSHREDVSFVADATSAILGGMDDKNIAVRVKAAWSLANLGDALAMNREEGDEDFITDFSDVLVLNVINVATKACQDSDKVKPNGVRALGSILRYISKKQLCKEAFNQAVTSGVKALVKCVSSGAMKVRWNACYAISNMYKNQDLSQGTSPWNADVLNVLCTVVKECKNFKVRINAAIALSVPADRSQFGAANLFSEVWDGVIEAFNTAENISDYIDFRYRDNLIEQICIAALHLLCLVKCDDLEELSPLLHKKGESLAAFLDKYYMARQKTSQMDVHLEKAKVRLESLDKEVKSDVQTDILEILHKCTQLTEAVEEDIEKSHITAFKQTYD